MPEEIKVIDIAIVIPSIRPMDTKRKGKPNRNRFNFLVDQIQIQTPNKFPIKLVVIMYLCKV